MNDEPDITDDWMNPHTHVSWEAPKLDDKTIYVIQRAKKTITLGKPGFIIEWKEWASFDSEAERNKELEKLRKKHPTWKLKASQYNPYLDSIRGPILLYGD